MIKLWLDDERDPKDPEIQMRFGAEGDEIWVKTAHDAIEFLKTGNVISISLDHDLGYPAAGTGYDVAKYIEEQAHFGSLPKLSWDVHSQSEVGRANIRRAMRNADNFWIENDISEKAGRARVDADK